MNLLLYSYVRAPKAQIKLNVVKEKKSKIHSLKSLDTDVVTLSFYLAKRKEILDNQESDWIFLLFLYIHQSYFFSHNISRLSF